MQYEIEVINSIKKVDTNNETYGLVEKYLQDGLLEEYQKDEIKKSGEKDPCSENKKAIVEVPTTKVPVLGPPKLGGRSGR